MSVASLVVAARTTGSAQLTRLGTQLRTLGSNISRVSRNLVAQQRAVSSVAGAYQDANGLWRNANGTLLTQRHTVTQVTTAFGRMVRSVRVAGRGVAVLGRTLGRATGGLAAGAGEATAAMGPMVAKIGLIAALALPAAHAVADLSGLIALIAPAAVAGGAAMVTLKLGLNGVQEAIEAGLSGDMEKFHKALGKLTPGAREFAASAVMIAKQWKPVGQAVQQALFGTGNLAHELRQLSITFKPLAERWLPLVAAEFSKAAKSASDFLTRPENVQKINDLLGATKATLAAALPIAGDFGRIFLSVASVAGPRLTILTEAVAKLADRFADFVDRAAKSGSMGGWIDKAIATGKQFWELLKAIGRVIGAVFKAGDGQGQSFLGTLTSLVNKWAEFANSQTGQAIIKIIGAVGIAIYKLAGIIPEVLNAIRPALNFLIQFALNGFYVIINAAAKAFGWVPGLGPKLKAAAEGFNKFRDDVNRALGGIRDESVNVDVHYRQFGTPAKQFQVPGAKIPSGNLRFKAAGGPVTKGMPYIVGEKRPELFVPSENGTILPRVPTGQGGPVVVSLVPAGTSGNDWLVQAINHAIRTGGLKLQVASNGRVAVAR